MRPEIIIADHLTGGTCQEKTWRMNTCTGKTKVIFCFNFEVYIYQKGYRWNQIIPGFFVEMTIVSRR